jgi:hypothetical protein
MTCLRFASAMAHRKDALCPGATCGPIRRMSSLRGVLDLDDLGAEVKCVKSTTRMPASAGSFFGGQAAERAAPPQTEMHWPVT